jgi:curved DNA-binding protein CbpA
MIDERDFEQIDRFLIKVGKGSLFEYYKLGTSTTENRLERAVSKRRNWAQGMQANPKYREEALWLIKNNKLVKRTLIDDRVAYLEALTIRVDNKSLETLTLFIKGTLASGVLTPEGEAAIHRQGQGLNLAREKVERCIERLLEEKDVPRAASQVGTTKKPDGDPFGGHGEFFDEFADDHTELVDFTDHYAILEVAPDATLEEIEKAHRIRYRWARNLGDKNKASSLYVQLDAAWRVLKDPDRRSAFDIIYKLRGASPGLDDEIFGELTSGAFQPIGSGRQPAIPPLLSLGGPPPPPELGPKVSGSFGVAFRPTDSPGTAKKDLSLTTHFQPDGTVDFRPSGRHGSRPPPPPPEVKKTVPLRGTKPRKRGPRLSLPGPETVDITVGRKPVSAHIVVKNARGGRMRGRISSNKDWLEVSPERLDPDAEEQAIEVVIHPKLMARNESVGLVTVTTDHGGRQTVTFRVQRRRVSTGEAVLFVLVALLMVSVTHSLGWIPDLTSLGGEDLSNLAPASLEIKVDPRADAIFVNDRAVGSGDYVLIEGGAVPLNRGFNVVVTLAGFGDVNERISLESGESRTLEIRLELRDPMTWAPEEDSEEVSLDEKQIRSLLNSRQKEFEGCLHKARAFGNTTPSSFEATLYATTIGRFQGLKVLSSENLTGDPIPCLNRQLRVLELPLLTGDYGKIDLLVEIGGGPPP